MGDSKQHGTLPPRTHHPRPTKIEPVCTRHRIGWSGGTVGRLGRTKDVGFAAGTGGKKRDARGLD